VDRVGDTVLTVGDGCFEFAVFAESADKTALAIGGVELSVTVAESCYRSAVDSVEVLGGDAVSGSSKKCGDR
jgi:hypothetical protein